MSEWDLEAAPYGTATILEVIELYKKSSGHDLTIRLAEMCELIKDVPETILHVAFKIYKDQLRKDVHLHPNYFINTALKIKKSSKKVKKTQVLTSEPLTDIGRSI